MDSRWPYEILYRGDNGGWYISPPVDARWDWTGNNYASAPGTWRYVKSDGQAGTFSCLQQFVEGDTGVGIGCIESTGSGGTKVYPSQDTANSDLGCPSVLEGICNQNGKMQTDPENGRVWVCQDVPGAFTPGACQSATIFMRPGPSTANFVHQARSLGEDRVEALTAMADGSLLAVGRHQGVRQYGFTSNGLDAMALRLNPDRSSVSAWGPSLSVGGTQRYSGVAGLPDGGVVLTGTSNQSVTFGGTCGNFTPNGGNTGSFVVRLAADGTCLWLRHYTSALTTFAVAPVLTTDGLSVWFSLTWSGTTSIGGMNLASSQSSQDAAGIRLALADGAHEFHELNSTTKTDEQYYIGGRAVGLGTFVARTSEGRFFEIRQYDSADLQTTSTGFLEGLDLNAMVADAAGGFAAGAAIQSSYNNTQWGGTTVTTSGNSDPFLVHFNASLSPTCTAVVRSLDGDVGSVAALAYEPTTGDVFLVGNNAGKAAFYGRYNASCQRVWLRDVNDTSTGTAGFTSVLRLPSGEIALSGYTNGTIDFPGVAELNTWNSTQDGYIAILPAQ